MTREEAKKMLPIIQAYAEGKEIQISTFGGWKTHEVMCFTSQAIDYRIKPEPEYIPFTVKDLIMFMLKYIRRKDSFESIKIIGCSKYCVLITIKGNIKNIPYEILFKEWEFVDGSPCGKPKE
jgi:hypothetical protein